MLVSFKSDLLICNDTWLCEDLTTFHVHFISSVTRKVAQYLGDVLEDKRDKLRENLKVNDGIDVFYHVYTMGVTMYLPQISIHITMLEL